MDTVNIVLAGNPNVGKSTLFNALTGLKQHTGNWPGKTVQRAEGSYAYKGRRYHLTDLPGLYSLHARSPEEELAAQVLRGPDVDCAVAVCDATCLGRSLGLALQVMALSARTVIALNLSDEARSRGISTDAAALESVLRVPVVEVSGARGQGLDALRETLRRVCDGFQRAAPDLPVWDDAAGPVRTGAALARRVQKRTGQEQRWRAGLDRLLMSRSGGYPAALLLLLAVLWLTVKGANAPGAILERLFARGDSLLSALLRSLPAWLRSLLIDGIYGTAARVITVMLPPMAIFFPLFTLLEDFGLLPRLAFLADRPLELCGACGKQALTGCMSLGCNAVGVTGCRIIDTPRERLLAILTASMLPCNGRFPTLILLGTAVLRGAGAAVFPALALLLSATMVLLVCALLSRTVLRGKASGFVLELPPYRVPRVGQVLVRSFLDRTARILGRALAVAAPAGAFLWLLERTELWGVNVPDCLARLLDPAGRAMGMSGPILLAFLLSFPANELLLPILLSLLALPADAALFAGGMGTVQILCTALFCLFHWPCGPTVLTVYRETGSLRWTAMSILVPTAVGIFLCLLVHGISVAL